MRPDGPEEASYAKVSVADFGKAVLRGLGWKPGEGVGKSKQVVKPHSVKLRPVLLGLGAVPRSAIGANSKADPTIEMKPEDGADKQKKDEEKEEEKEHKHKSKQRKACWMLPGIRVRIISKTFAEGKYYRSKAIVQAISDIEKCYAVVQFADGRIEDRMSQSKLETALPKSGGEVVLVSGIKRGARGKLLDRDSAKALAHVQLYGDMSVESFSFDHVAEYMVRGDDLDFVA